MNPGPFEEELNRFLRSNRVLHVDRHFVSCPGSDHGSWNFCVGYLELERGQERGFGQKLDYREILSPEDFAVYAKLRSLRKETAEREQVPVFAVFSNDQLAEMVQTKARTLEQLGKIKGVGESRTSKYGEKFLDILREAYKE